MKLWKEGDSGDDAKTGGHWIYSFDDLIIPVTNEAGEEVIILAVPFLRSDVVQNASYSQGVNDFLRELTAEARKKHPGRKCIMMAHMYAKGSDIAKKDASEKIIIGGQEEVDLEGWNDHPDYMTCGHIHKRQHIWNTDWARYTGSILPMSFAEKDYTHGIDLITIGCDKGEKEEMEAKEEEEEGMKEEEEKEKENCKGKSKEWKVDFLEYKPQHSLRILPEDEEELTFKKWQKLINSELSERTDGELSDHFDYVMLKVKQEKLSSDDIKELEKLVNEKDAVLCKIQRIIPQLDLSTIQGSQHITSIEDIINRPPLDTLKEAFAIRHNAPMNERQEKMLSDLLTKSSL
ncbi:MAG: exonuclease SbcCD subunit D [Segatella copri]